MNFLMIWVMLKQLRRGVQPDGEILDEAIEFLDSHARDVKVSNLLDDYVLEVKELPDC